MSDFSPSTTTPLSADAEEFIAAAIHEVTAAREAHHQEDNEARQFLRDMADKALSWLKSTYIPVPFHDYLTLADLGTAHPSSEFSASVHLDIPGCAPIRHTVITSSDSNGFILWTSDFGSYLYHWRVVHFFAKDYPSSLDDVGIEHLYFPLDDLISAIGNAALISDIYQTVLDQTQARFTQLQEAESAKTERLNRLYPPVNVLATELADMYDFLSVADPDSLTPVSASLLTAESICLLARIILVNSRNSHKSDA